MYTGLYTVCNEYNEIRIQGLVATTSLRAVEEVKMGSFFLLSKFIMLGYQTSFFFFFQAYNGLRSSQNKYNFLPTQLVYSDKPWASRPTINRLLPSTTVDVIPIPGAADSQNDPLVLPSEVTIECLSSPESINHALRTIMSDLEHHNTVAVGFDLEWNVRKVNNRVVCDKLATLYWDLLSPAIYRLIKTEQCVYISPRL